LVEIRLSLDTIDPGGPAAREAGFCGWLGLLRALYEVTGSPASWP